MKKSDIYIPAAMAVGMFCFYTYFCSWSLYGADAPDFLSAIYTKGIPHPPGYPLYTSLGIALMTIFPHVSLPYLISFLSVIPSAISIGCFTYLSYRMQGKWIPAIVSSLILSWVHPFWLYSEVVEVFSLHILFFIVLFLLLFLFSQNPSWKKMYLISYITSLSYAQHQTIVFLLPSYVVVLYGRRHWFFHQNNRTMHICKALFFAILGLLPWIYIVLVNTYQTNWMGPFTWHNFFDLLLRTRYGTFTSSSNIGYLPILRILNVWTFFSLLVEDIGWIGMILYMIGLVSLAYSSRTRWWIYASASVSYLFFLFYASFPLTNDFQLGTYERFLLPLYVLSILGISIGISSIFTFIHHHRSIFRTTYFLSESLVRIYLTIIFFLIPFHIYLKEYRTISNIQDMSIVERYGYDALQYLPTKSIVFLQKDSLMFSSEYVRTVSRVRTDISLLTAQSIYYPLDRIRMKKKYPELPIDVSGSDASFLSSFLLQTKQHPVFSDIKIDHGDGEWVPWGLLYRYVPRDMPLNPQEVLDMNASFWSNISPYADAISTQKNFPLIIAHIPRMYAIAKAEVGIYALSHKHSDLAGEYLSDAHTLDNTNASITALWIQWLTSQTKCVEAKKEIETIHLSKEDEAISLLARASYAKECDHDASKSASYIEQYKEHLQGSESELKDL